MGGFSMGYCWWTKSCTTFWKMSIPMIYRFLTIPGWLFRISSVKRMLVSGEGYGFRVSQPLEELWRKQHQGAGATANRVRICVSVRWPSCERGARDLVFVVVVVVVVVFFQEISVAWKNCRFSLFLGSWPKILESDRALLTRSKRVILCTV